MTKKTKPKIGDQAKVCWVPTWLKNLANVNAGQYYTVTEVLDYRDYRDTKSEYFIRLQGVECPLSSEFFEPRDRDWN
jgi:hypothetical protein